MEVVIMKRAGLVSLVLMASLAGCSSNDPSVIGGYNGEYSCNQSAGYLWCEKTQECERPWELAAEVDFANTQANFENYCGSSLEDE